MSTIKISALPSGNPAQSGDEIPIARSGTSYKITAGSIVDLAGNVSGPTSSVNNQIALFAGTAGDSIQAASTTGLLKASSGVIAAAVPGVDYGDVSGADTISTDNALARFDGTSGKLIQKSVATLSDAGALALPGTANTLTLSGSSTGNPATIAATGTDTNIELRLTGKGAIGGVSLGTADGTSLFAYTIGTAVNYFQAIGSPTGSSPFLYAAGSDTNVSMSFNTQGTGVFDFFTNSTDRQFRVAHTGNAVNYLQVTGGASGNSPVISAQGSGTNLDINLTPKGTGNVSFGTYTGTALSIAGYIEIKDSGGTVRKLAVVA